MTAPTSGTEPANARVSHLDKVGSVEDLGTLEALPRRTNNLVPGRVRQFNPFDNLVIETHRTGKPRLAVADDLESAKVLIRRAAARADLGIDVVPTIAPDGRNALAYLARDKRPKTPNAAEGGAAEGGAVETPNGAAPVDQTDQESGLESYDDDVAEDAPVSTPAG